MAWTAPMTAIPNTVFTAAQFNTHVRDNLNETAPAKSTTTGSLFVGNGVNTIAERIPAEAAVLTLESTTSTSYTDLATVGPTVSVTTGQNAIVIVHCSCANSTTTTAARMAYEVSGATSITPSDNRGVGNFGAIGVGGIQSGVAVHGFGGSGPSLTPGVNTFTSKYRAGAPGGQADFLSRRIVVIPL